MQKPAVPINARPVPSPQATLLPRPEASAAAIPKQAGFLRRADPGFASVWLLQGSLGAVYLWFGALKLTDHSPVHALLQAAYGSLVTQPLYVALALFEIALGLVLLTGTLRRWAALAAIFHLLGTFSILAVAPVLAFAPAFPALTMAGEFIVKNVVLIAAAGALLLERRRQANLVAAVGARWPRLRSSQQRSV
jgi:putative oxidoreductase